MIPEEETLVPILLESDETHLTNFSRDKWLWPVYISRGNIRSSIRNTPTMHGWIPIALLPIGPKRVNKISWYSVYKQEIPGLHTVHDIIRHLLQPLSAARYHGGHKMDDPDRDHQLGIPRPFCWLTDYMENATIHGIANNYCYTCIIPTKNLGKYSETGFPAYL